MTSQLTEAPGATQISVPTLRRWIRARRLAADSPRFSAGDIYLVVLTLAVTIALVGPYLAPLVWPAVPAGPAGGAAMTSIAVLGLLHLALLGALRSAGPMAIGRADLTWLFHAPVSRRALLLPSLLVATAAAALTGGLAAVAALGWLGYRPVDPAHVIAAVTLGAGTGALLASLAGWSQLRPRLRRTVDRAGYTALALLAVVVADHRIAGHDLVAGLLTALTPWGWLTALPATAATAVGALLMLGAAALTVLAARRLDDIPPWTVHSASLAVGTFLDSAYAVEPSFVSDLRERRFWSGRRLRTVPIRRKLGLPVLVSQDLLMLRRRSSRLVWLAGFAALPLLLADGPPLLLPLLVLAGLLVTAGTTMEAIRRDARDPALLRLLGYTGRQALLARLVVPTGLAAAWAAGTLELLALLGHLPPGPWWALGLALAPAAAAAAAHRARTGLVDNGLPNLETPMGSLAPGPLIWLLTGSDLLVPLSLPAIIWLTGRASDNALTWIEVLIQAAISITGAVLYALFWADRRQSRL